MAEVKYLDKTGLTSVWSKVKGIVTPKADKVSGATAGHLAGLNSGGNLMDSGLPASNIAQKDGSYSGMTVGAAEDLVSAESVASEFTSRITGGSTAVGKGGTALLDKIKGRTLVWNQLLANGNFSSTTGWEPLHGTFAVENNIGTFTYSGSGEGSIVKTSINYVVGHKYLLKGFVLSSVESRFVVGVGGSWVTGVTTLRTQSGLAGSWSEAYTFFNVESGSNANSFFIRQNNDISLKNVQLLDLTLLFGAGSEPATPEEFEALYPGPYYDYNQGTLISNAATAIETVGFNQWDEEWEVGGINTSTGEKNTATNTIRSKNYIPVLPNTTYYASLSPKIASVYYYDSNKAFISFDYNSSGTRTTPANCYYIMFIGASSYGTTYLNDICINLSDPSRNGTYEPYWRSELELNIPTLTGKLNGTGNSVVIFPDGLRSAGTVYDEIVGNKAIKRIGASNLGERSWTLTGDGRGFYTTGLSSLISSNAMVRYICPRYDSVFNSSDADQIAAADKTISAKTSGNVFIKDSAYTDAATFQAAMSGVTLYYELATPEEYILDEALPTAMRNDPYGTERRLPEDTAAIVTAPFRADITYSTNIKEAVQSLPQNYININSMQDFLAALGTLMDGTWTMRPADGKFDFTFTPNPSNE